MDNRIRLEPTSVSTDPVGQNHDTYPQAGTQARSDLMRSYLIGLLSNQSGVNEPVEKRDGTLWFDTDSDLLKIYKDGDWVDLAEVIKISDELTLSGFASAVTALINEQTFNGTASASISSISIPTSIKQNITDVVSVKAYINGLLVFPSNVSFNASTIGFSSPLQAGDQYVIEIRYT